eukprot:SAG22_NODE_9172_length_605_cov_1.671937_2_plen_62_part_00
MVSVGSRELALRATLLALTASLWALGVKLGVNAWVSTQAAAALFANVPARDAHPREAAKGV